jgi:serine/threonine protein kinase
MSEMTRKLALPVRSTSLSGERREAQPDNSDEDSTLPRWSEVHTAAPNPAGDWSELEDLIDSAPSAPVPLVNAPAFPLPKPGDVIGGRYEIINHADSGGMGTVYEAWDAQRKIKVALKFIQGSWPDKSEALNRFRREARALISVYHKNILRVLDFGEVPMPYLVTEWLVGETLSRLIEREGRLSPAQAGSMFLQLCAGLSEVHSVGIIHRDIKPSNIFVLAGGTEERQVRLLDFGLVKKVQTSVNDNSTWRDSLTKQGFAPGTPNYMSPEQLLGRSLDHRSDLFSAALVAFKMLTGVNAIKRGMPAFIMLHSENPPLPSRDLRGLPVEVDDFFRTALHGDPNRRYSSALEMGIAFKTAVSLCGDVDVVAVERPSTLKPTTNDHQDKSTRKERRVVREEKRGASEERAVTDLTDIRAMQGWARSRPRGVAALLVLGVLGVALLGLCGTSDTVSELQEPALLVNPPVMAPQPGAVGGSHSSTQALPSSADNNYVASPKALQRDGSRTTDRAVMRPKGSDSGSTVNSTRAHANKRTTPSVIEPGF